MSDLSNILVQWRVNEAIRARRLPLILRGKGGMPVTDEERRAILTEKFGKIQSALGPERFASVPIEVLEQFTVQCAIQNIDPGQALKDLVETFMITFGDNDTFERAHACAHGLVLLNQARNLPVRASTLHKPNEGRMAH